MDASRFGPTVVHYSMMINLVRWLVSPPSLECHGKTFIHSRASLSPKGNKSSRRVLRWCEERHPDEPFMGSLNSQRKSGLQDIAYSLGLDIEGTVEDLKSRISTFFDGHEERRTDPRYIRLFPHLARQTRMTALTDTSAPSGSNSHNDNVDPQPRISNNQYNHFTSLAHNTPSNHASS